MINVLSLNKAQLGTTASELHAPLKRTSKGWKKAPTKLLLMVSSEAVTCLKFHYSIACRDHCLQQLSYIYILNWLHRKHFNPWYSAHGDSSKYNVIDLTESRGRKKKNLKVRERLQFQSTNSICDAQRSKHFN